MSWKLRRDPKTKQYTRSSYLGKQGWIQKVVGEDDGGLGYSGGGGFERTFAYMTDNFASNFAHERSWAPAGLGKGALAP